MNKEKYEFLKDGINRDIDTRKRRYDEMRAEDHRHPYYGLGGYITMALGMQPATLGIKTVIFHNPATIIYWEDGSKTVVKADNEPFDPEKGLAMAIAKKAFGNKGNYFNEIKKWVDKYEGDNENGQK